MNKLLLCALLAGVCFGFWPIVMARSGIKNPVITALIVSGVTFFSMILVAFFSKQEDEPLPVLSQSTFLFVAVIAGLLNAIGTLIFQKSMIGMAAVDQQRIWVIPTIVVAMQIITNAIASSVFFGGGSFGFRQIIGIFLALIAALLLGVK